MTNLADKLNLTRKDVGPNVVAAGMLVSLWLWAAQNATDGDLSECSDRAIAEAAEFKRKPSLFIEALISAKLLDEDRKLHNWDEYATLLMECDDQQREKTRRRVAKHRARKKAMKETPGNDYGNGGCNVTETPGNAPTIQYHTIPNHTVPEKYNHTSEVNKGTLTVDRTEGAPAPCDGRSFTEFWKNYPPGKGGDREEAWKAWKEMNPSTATAWRILDALRDWTVSAQWAEDNGRFIPGAARFLREQKWLSPPDVMAEGMDDSDAPYEDALAYAHRLMAERKDGM